MSTSGSFNFAIYQQIIWYYHKVLPYQFLRSRDPKMTRLNWGKIQFTLGFSTFSFYEQYFFYLQEDFFATEFELFFSKRNLESPITLLRKQRIYKHKYFYVKNAKMFGSFFKKLNNPLVIKCGTSMKWISSILKVNLQIIQSLYQNDIGSAKKC